MKTLSFIMLFPLLFGIKNSEPMNFDPYKSEWKKVEKFENEGLPRSAWDVVKEIHTKAIKEKNTPQIVKSFVYTTRYMAQLEEGGISQSIVELEEYIDKNEGIEKQILQSFLGQWYQSYAQQNRYKLNQQTAVIENDEDYTTWSLEKLQAKSSELYLASVATENTKYANVQDYEEIIAEINPTSVKNRPSLYELLVDRAIGYFSNTNNMITEPVYKFEINGDEYFDEWSKLNIEKLDVKQKDSKIYQALLLYQSYLKHFKKEGNKLALANLELSYLKFINNHSVLTNKSTLYKEGLERLAAKYKSMDIQVMIMYDIALLYFNNQVDTNKNQTNNKSKVNAYKTCEKAISQHPKSEGAHQCQSLINTLEQKSLQIKIKKCYTTGEKPELVLTYNNIEKVYFRLYKVDSDKLFDNINNRYNNRKDLEKNVDAKLLKEWNVAIPNFKDYDAHSTIDLLPAMKTGHYLLKSSNNSSFGKKDVVMQNFFQVSNLSYDVGQENDMIKMVVRDRFSSNPIANATIKIYKSYYNRTKRKNVVEYLSTARSDKDGFHTFPIEDNINYIFHISKEDDVFFQSNNHRFYHNSRKNRPRTTAHIFTDRAIYRPGQKVHFKALLTEQGKDRIPSIVPHQSATIMIRDANHQVVKEYKMTSNEYGSFQGQYDLPTTGLLGRFSIQVSGNLISGNHQIRVEEYKRPKFEVKIKDLTETYTLNEMITVSANTKALAGVNLDGAKVQYKVVRTAYFPYYRYYWRNPYYGRNAAEVQIAHGTSITDDEGNVSFDFKAVPDLSMSKKYKPQFSYKVTIDVTDINGETHTDTKTINIAYHSVSLGLQMTDNADVEESYDIKTVANNLNGVPMSVDLELKIDKLIEPDYIPVASPWGKVDTFIDPSLKESFERPSQQTYYESLKVDKKVFEKSFTQSKGDTIKSSELGLQSGIYRVTLSHLDKSGELLETVKYITITDYKTKEFPKSKLLFSKLNQEKYHPGDKVELTFGSSNKDIHILYELIKRGQTVYSKWISTGERNTIVEIPVLESDRGGFQVRTSILLDNKLYQEMNSIHVPWNNKQLNIEYLSYRDHLEPGSKEEWRIKISGDKKEKVAAELLAGMYDASLDLFVQNHWAKTFFPQWYAHHSRSFTGQRINHLYNATDAYFKRKDNGSFPYVPKTPYFKYSIDYYGQHMRMRGSRPEASGYYTDGAMMKKSMPRRNVDNIVATSAGVMADADESLESAAPMMNEVQSSNKEAEQKSNDSEGNNTPIQIRKNLNETVFFYPQLHTDKDGNIEIRFTMNEALTRWKFMTFAHTKDLAYAFDTKEIITQKKLMVFPQAPRFFREGDKIEFTTKVSNLSEEQMSVGVKLELFDALTNEVIQLFDGSQGQQSIIIDVNKSKSVAWNLSIPYGKYQAIGYRVIAKSKNYGDGEENTVPVVSNRMLVTETMPLPVKGKEKKSFVFNSMKEKIGSPTLDNFNYSVEFTANPVWYAVQALPYINTSHPECSEYLFNRFFVNSLASHIANSSPKIQSIFDQWRNYDSDALLSNLSKNQELKSALLEETPWVMDALDEEQQKKNIALLFDLNKMSYEKTESLKKLRAMQNYEGAFTWFPGGRSNRYMTQNIIEGIGHLIQLGVIDRNDPEITDIINNAIPYLDKELTAQYQRLKKSKAKMSADHLGSMAIHYLYMRSFFTEIKVDRSNKTAYDYYHGQAVKYGLLKGVYLDGMVALVLHRTNEKTRANAIINSLAERAKYNEELGMYWDENAGYYWYNLPIERHALLIEAFSEVGQKQEPVDLLKTWLLKHKQTNNWKTTKATSAAIYALLIANPGQDQQSIFQLDKTETPSISVANKPLDLTDVKQEAGTGYFKVNMDKKDINIGMADVEVYNPNDNIAWGSVYWQYFEDLDKIKSFKDTPLKMSKKLFKQTTVDTGEKLVSIDKTDKLEVGDKIIVRVILEVDRAMEYVHLKDMRASSMEPINVLSQYKWQGGLGYYESTKDLATHFFIDYLPKGKYVFEYPLRIAHKGDFSNGITSLQCMYAPEFSSHSVGRRVVIK